MTPKSRFLGNSPVTEEHPLLGNKPTQESHSKHEISSSLESSRPRGNELRTLLIASGLCLVFFVVELVGGYIAHSLAIMADASHLLSDLAGFVISILAIVVSRLPANASLTYGFARAEVLGAFVSILLIWVLTFILVVFALERLFNPITVNGALMLLLGFIGLSVNLSMGLVLGHGHGGSSYSHAHDLAEHSQSSHGHMDDHDHIHDHIPVTSGNKSEDPESGRNGVNTLEERKQTRRSLFLVSMWDSIRTKIGKFAYSMSGHDIESVNVRAAFLHVLGDALQNIGVIVAAVIIMVVPSWSFVDPLCTIFFAVIVISTTQRLARETLGVLMEGTPENCDITAIYSALTKLDGVRSVGDLHVWSITAKRPSLSVHIWANGTTNGHDMLKSAQKELATRFDIYHSTIQVNCEVIECCDSKEREEDSSKLCVTPSKLS